MSSLIKACMVFQKKLSSKYSGKFGCSNFVYNWKICNTCFYHIKHGYYGYKPDANIDFNSFTVDKEILSSRNESPNIHRLINAYREFGHLKANINPLEFNNRNIPELEASYYGLSLHDSISTKGLLAAGEETVSVQELDKRLKHIYAGELTAEFMHLPSFEEREWFAKAFEELSDEVFTDNQKREIAEDLLKSQVWDHFLALKFPTVKRYGAEGAESTLVFYKEIFRQLSLAEVEELIFGMCHRGRLNLLTGLLKVNPEMIFSKIKGLPEYPAGTQGQGDVFSHFISSVDLKWGGEKPLHISVIYNPSHLEAQTSVACGKARGRQRRLRDGHYSSESGAKVGDKVSCLQVHGDAALSGQGIIQETLNMSSTPNFNIGGCLHMCVNNQIGYTTPANIGRSSLYCTDVAKMCALPIIHVNGDHPEAVVKAARLTVAYNRTFRRDIFIDLVCWRRWGHNELDDPRFTNPGMYKIIDNRMSVPDTYAASLIQSQIMSEEERSQIVASYKRYLAEKLTLSEQYKPEAAHLLKHWSGMAEAPDAVDVWDTGVDVSLLKYLGAKSVQIPDNFPLHPHLKKTFIESRLDKLASGKGLDWATGEALAIASLLHQGCDVRLSGEDVGRGTFSQRHCMLVDQDTDDCYIPLNHMEKNQTNFLEVANSILSEEAVLGFEYGVSIDSPNILCIWEAQFGDFFNGAQTILDTFVASGEEKWLTQSGLTLILPHGYDGAGPDHSSCRIERFLQMSNSKESHPDSERVNWNVVFPTNAAQIFHVLRRQMLRNFRKPLVIIGPKAILRLPAAYSGIQDMAPGTHFLPVIGDPDVVPDAVKKVVFVSGKHYYFLKAEREKRNQADTALIRVESLCPFPTQGINEELSKYKKAKTFIWAQEEHRNMGAWSFVSSRFRNLCGTELRYAGRSELGVTAVGIGVYHKKEVDSLIKQTFDS